MFMYETYNYQPMLTRTDKFLFGKMSEASEQPQQLLEWDFLTQQNHLLIVHSLKSCITMK